MRAMFVDQRRQVAFDRELKARGRWHEVVARQVESREYCQLAILTIEVCLDQAMQRNDHRRPNGNSIRNARHSTNHEIAATCLTSVFVSSSTLTGMTVRCMR